MHHSRLWYNFQVHYIKRKLNFKILMVDMCSKFQYGGGGITGALLCLGQSMALWPLKWVTRPLQLRYLDKAICLWNITWSLTWALNITSLELLLQPILALSSFSYLSLPSASSSSTSKGDKKDSSFDNDKILPNKLI